METSDYIIAWAVYLLGAAVLSSISWRLCKRFLQRDLAYLLHGILLAVLFTPWYVLPDQEYLAPAIIIFAMDTITMDAAAGIRALIPLVMALMLVLVITVIVSLVGRIRRR
ncbi:MAG: hypothetical protein RQ899_05175 [Pseudomonadales bacterium]|nr:hypothetical protein [Pseudomonadales bacterium]